MSRAPRLFLLALLIDLVGAGGALLVSLRTWQTVRVLQADSPMVVSDLSGRTVDAASTAFGLVALAGIVAVLATRGVLRRAIGAVLLLAGLGLVWRASVSAGAVSADRARSLVESAHKFVNADGVTPMVTTHGLWPVLSALGGVLVAVSGGLIAWRGHRGQVLSVRYEPPAGSAAAEAAAAPEPGTPEDEARERLRAATALWSALDRGEDPTR